MSKIQARIINIQTQESLNIVEFEFMGNVLKMMSLELSEDTIVDAKVELSIKPFSVALAKNLQGMLSYSNQVNAIVNSIDAGELLWSLKLLVGESRIESIITASSAKNMNIKVGDEVTALIKANEISIVRLIK